jgi:hemolysin activation/secretion protein
VQNALVRDGAVIGSIELRRMVWQLPIPGLSKGDSDGEIDLGVFVDGGRGWDHRAIGGDPGGLLSVGISLEWALRQGMVAEFDYGYGVVRPQNQPDFLQPVSFNVRVGF